ncbi:MAG TPA: sigma-70 family RNA polymerase sigma factor, partial [Bacteroidia bacterium]|nr:sigma-70 family RNA polymerase sigma factor [Bacteroidia bacterium]
PKVASLIRQRGGTLEEAKDIFQDALLIYYEKKSPGGFSPNTSDGQYLNGIARHLWYKKFNENKNKAPLNQDVLFKTLEEEPAISDNLMKFVESSGKKCLDLLTSFYYDHINMKELALRFGFSGERSATAQKFKCLEKVRTAIREKSIHKADFYE